MNPRLAERLDPTHDRKRAQPWEAVMANEEHVALLKQGVDAWNKWRRENPKVRPDLREAYLRGANLLGICVPFSEPMFLRTHAGTSESGFDWGNAWVRHLIG